MRIGRAAILSPETRTTWNLMENSTDGRILTWTEKGYLALVPAATEAGDVVALLKGARLPFILRPKGGAWKLLGPSYIHGIMDGELVDDDAVRTIKIC